MKLTTYPPSSAEVKNAWSNASIPPYAFIAWCSVKKEHRDNFSFTSYLLCPIFSRDTWGQ